jgi:hypothetical protein
MLVIKTLVMKKFVTIKNVGNQNIGSRKICGDWELLNVMFKSHFGCHRVYMATKMGPSIAFMLALSNLIWALIRLT